MATQPTVTTQFFARGTLAGRPATPAVPTGAILLYYTTDTAKWFIWESSSWIQVG